MQLTLVPHAHDIDHQEYLRYSQMARILLVWDTSCFDAHESLLPGSVVSILLQNDVV